MNKNLRWKLLTILAVFVVFFALGVYPILAQRYQLPSRLAGGQAAEARARPEGRRPPRPARADRRRAAADHDDDERADPRRAEHRRHRGRARSPSTSPTTLPRRRSAAGSGRGLPAHRGRAGGRQLRPQSGRRRHLRLHDEAEHREGPARAGGRAGAARRSIGASTSSASPSRTSRATAQPATRSSCSCPA